MAAMTTRLRMRLCESVNYHGLLYNSACYIGLHGTTLDGEVGWQLGEITCIGVNATGDAEDSSPAIVGEPGTNCHIYPKSLTKLLPTVRLRRRSYTELMHAGSVRCGQNTKRGRKRQRETSELQQQQNSLSAAVCHCHQDLLDVVDVNVLMKELCWQINC